MKKYKANFFLCPSCEKYFNIINGKSICYKDITGSNGGKRGILFCDNCLQHPEKFNPNKIYNFLIKDNWESNNAKLVSNKVETLIPIKILRRNKLSKINE